MESSDDEIIENNCYEDEIEPNSPEKKQEKIKNIKLKSSPKPSNNNNEQIKNTNTAPTAKKQIAKTKQIISVSVILPKKTQNPKRNTNTKSNNNNTNKNSNNPFSNPETKPKFKPANEVYQEIKSDIDIQNHNNVLLVKKENNGNNTMRNNTNKIKRNKIENITVKNNKNKFGEIGNNIIKRIDKINDEYLSNTFLKPYNSGNNSTIKHNKTKKSEKKVIIRNNELNLDKNNIIEKYNTINYINESAAKSNIKKNNNKPKKDRKSVV